MAKKQKNLSYLSDIPDIPMVKTEYRKKNNRWVKVKNENELVSERNHYFGTNSDTLKSFRGLGGYEKNEFGYTPSGYKVIKNVSISPTRDIKYVSEYDFSKKKK